MENESGVAMNKTKFMVLLGEIDEKPPHNKDQINMENFIQSAKICSMKTT